MKVNDDHFSGTPVAGTPQATYPRIVTALAKPVRIFGLAAGGVYLAAGVTTNAVRSYRTISPLLGVRMKDEF